MGESKVRTTVTYIVGIIIPVVVGFVSAALTSNNMRIFAELNKPPMSPPAWLFPVAWTVLYVLMGIASARIVLIKGDDSKKLLVVYAFQLVFNFFWCILFFNLSNYWLAAAWLLVMWILVFMFTFISRKVDRIACICFVPYIIWCTFAMYLNIGVALLN